MRMNKPVRTAEATAVARFPGKVPQVHGGALLTGGVKGNEGGRKPSWFRDRVLKLLEQEATIDGKRMRRVDFAAAVVDGKIKGATAADRLSAWKELTKIGIPQKIEATGPDNSPIPLELSIRLIRPDADASDNG